MAPSAAVRPQAGGKETLQFAHGNLQLEDWLDGLRQNADARAWLKLDPTVFHNKKQQLRADKLIHAWVQQLVASACGLSVGGIIVGRDAVLRLDAIDQEAVRGPRCAICSMLGWRDCKPHCR